LPGIATAALLSALLSAVTVSAAAAARHWSAAIGASHPFGYKIVHGGPFNAPPGVFDPGGFARVPFVVAGL